MGYSGDDLGEVLLDQGDDELGICSHIAIPRRIEQYYISGPLVAFLCHKAVQHLEGQLLLVACPVHG